MNAATFILGFGLGLFFGAGGVIVGLTLGRRLDAGMPAVGKPVAHRLPDPPDAELALRRKLREQAVARGADDILERAQVNGVRVTPEQAREQAARLLDDVGLEA